MKWSVLQHERERTEHFLWLGNFYPKHASSFSFLVCFVFCHFLQQQLHFSRFAISRLCLEPSNGSRWCHHASVQMPVSQKINQEQEVKGGADEEGKRTLETFAEFPFTTTFIIPLSCHLLLRHYSLSIISVYSCFSSLLLHLSMLLLCQTLFPFSSFNSFYFMKDKQMYKRFCCSLLLS